MMVPKILRIFGAVADARIAWRAEGASAAEITTRTRNLVRLELETEVPPLETWPEHMLAPRCGDCAGTGLVLRFSVIDRHGIDTTQGFPCRCPKGARFMPRKDSPDDFTQAGKGAKPSKPFTQLGR